MRKITIALLTLAVAGSLGADDRRTESYSFDAASLTRLELEHAVGDLEIVESAGNTVEIRMTAECDGWRCDVDEIELVARPSGGTLHLEVDGYPRFGGDVSVDLEIRMPGNIALEIERGVGSTEIRGMTGDIEVETGVGEIDIEASAAAFRSASVEAGVGDADLRIGGSRVRSSSSFVGEESRWQDGQGSSRIDLEVGVGSVDVTLR